MKRLIAAGMVLLLLLCMVTASASTAGTSGDPLITLYFLDNEFADSVKADISATLGGAADKAISRLDDLYRSSVGYSFAPGFVNISLPAGDTILISAGGSFIVVSGSATMTVTGGTVINVSTGSEVTSGEQLTQYQRYFCTEDTTALITANSALNGQVDGYYFVDAPEPAKQHPVFKDVTEDDWFFSAVDFVYENGLFTGTTTSTFSPGATMTRAMFVTVLWRLELSVVSGQGSVGGNQGLGDGNQGSVVNTPNSSLPTPNFVDVAADEWYFNAVEWANTNSIVTGFDDDTFRPDAPVTREQMAAILIRYMNYKEIVLPVTAQWIIFADEADISDYAMGAIQTLNKLGIINGTGTNAGGQTVINPKGNATRAQVAQIMLNYCSRLASSNP